MRSKKALLNSMVSLFLQLVTFTSGLILPRLIISHFGSSTNGLVTSITQFLAFLTLLEAGVGGVVKASLYKPLADENPENISRVAKAAELFFRKIAYISCAYIAVLALTYSLFINRQFSWRFTSLLILIIGISTIAQYYFGLTYRLLLDADQRGYVYNLIQMCSIILNIIFSVALIYAGFGIHIVLLVSSLIFIIRPLIINFYATKKYKVNKKCPPSEQALAQRWNGAGFSFAAFIHKKTDVFLLTILSTLREVSVYSVYITVTNGLISIVTITTNSFQAAFGNMIAKNETETLNKTFRLYVLISNEVVITIFTAAYVLILPFISLYTKNVNDVNYIRPIFSILILSAEMFYCLRQPYQAIITAAGHYKQTQRGAFIEAGLNIIISLILIKPLGLCGVAIGTLISIVYRTADLAVYLKNNIINFPLTHFLKRTVISGVSMLITIAVTYKVSNIDMDSFLIWIKYAVFVSLVSLIICTVFNIIFYQNDVKHLLKIVRSLLKK